jgi:hypothetical protein
LCIGGQEVSFFLNVESEGKGVKPELLTKGSYFLQKHGFGVRHTFQR